MITKRQSLIYGFSVFSMFFGSGNLVFPLQIGLDSGHEWLMGFLGLFVTGIILPFMGLLVIKLYNGSYEKFFSQAGKVASYALPLFTLSLLGSFGVIPRCIVVAGGGLERIYPSMPLVYFSAIFSVICYLCCLKDRYLISIIGKWLTPLLLIFIGLIIICGVMKAPEAYNILEAKDAYLTGFFQGYETMDLFAAFFFSSFIFKQIQNESLITSTNKEIVKAAIWPGIIGAFLLGLVYMGFVYLGAHYADITKGLAPEHILPLITTYLMGDYAAIIIAIIVIFSCLTTAVALNNIFARYLWKLLKLNEDKYKFMLMITSFTSFIISLLDFKAIASFLVPLLEISYPALIILTFISILTPRYQKLKIFAFYSVISSTLLYKII